MKNNITTTISPITISTTTVINIIQQAESLATNINNYGKALVIIIPSVVAAICSIGSVFYYSVKLYKNSCLFKVMHKF